MRYAGRRVDFRNFGQSLRATVVRRQGAWLIVRLENIWRTEMRIKLTEVRFI